MFKGSNLQPEIDLPSTDDKDRTENLSLLQAEPLDSKQQNAILGCPV
jgi:hypothetical protein